jgi:type I restriction enzyme M protein
MPLPPDFERTLWSTADTLWANTGLKPSEYAEPVLSLVFLRFADVRFAQRTAEIAKKPPRMGVKPAHYHEARVPFLPERARYDWLLQVPAGGVVVDGKKRTLGELLDAAMVDIEASNESLRGILYRGYARFPVSTLNDLLKRFSEIPSDVEGDVFGRIYEYFLGEFAKRSLEKGGEFYTPVSVVRLIVDVLQPFAGRVLDPACGSGGMFVQSARFVSEHGKADSALSVHGIEKAEQTLRLCRLNLAIHGLPGNVVVGNSYYDDPFKQTEGFQFVMANPPFNQSGFDRERCEKNGKRYPLGVPSTNNANFLWIQLFYTYLAKDGRAGFVMANSASDARGSELEIRQKLIEEGVVDVMITLSGTGGHRAVHRRARGLPAGRPGAPGADRGAGGVPRQHCPAVSGGGGRRPEGQRGVDEGGIPEGEVRVRRGALQAGDAQGDRRAGVEPEPGALRGRGRGQGGGLRLQGAPGGAQ